MFKSILQYSLSLVGHLVLLLILIFPLVSFKISTASAIFPAIDIIIIYYLTCYCGTGILRILLISPFIDQLYGLPLGCNTLAFISGGLFLKIAAKWFLVKEYVGNFLLFCCYSFIVFSIRYLNFITEIQYPALFEIIFQCLTTIFSYPLLKILLDKISSLFNLKV